MDPADALSTLRRVELFRSFDDDELAVLAGALREVEVEAGQVVVREGEEDRALFIVASGSARVTRAGAHLGTVPPGGHFGEVALIVGGRRTASVVAEVDGRLFALDADAFDAFAESHARLALRALREIFASTSSHLARMNATVGLLLRERGLPRRVDVEVKLGGECRTCRAGTIAMDLLPDEVDGAPVVAALIDGRARPLTAPIAGDCALAPLTTEHWEGQRIYRRSLALALLEAATSLGIGIRMGSSLGLAQRVLLDGDEDRAEAAAAIGARLRELVTADAPLTLERVSVVEAVEYFTRLGWMDAARLVETTRHTSVPLVSYGERFVLGGDALLPSTGRLSLFTLVPDGDELLLVHAVPGAVHEGPREDVARVREARLSGIPPVDVALEARDVSLTTVRMTRQQRTFLGALSIESVGDFNRACIDGNVGGLIRVTEGYHEKSIGRIADQIAAHGGDVRIVCIAGPSSSGKTTFIERLDVQLQVNGLTPRGLGLDDYYVDRDATPRDADGELDFEALEALQLDLLAEHLERLVAGDEVQTARFDFREGKSLPAGGPLLRLGPGELLMLEGIHALNPRLTERLPAEQIFRIFVCPLVQLPFDRVARMHASDVRLLRRIVRDRHGRSQSAADTISRWPSVRRGERRHIFPFQGNADAVFDTSLVYETSVLKVFAERYLLEVPPDHPAQATAERLLTLLERWVTIYPDHVPPTSILREFIGGSGFHPEHVS